MSRASVLARGRAFAAAGVTDTCTVTRPGSGEPTLDPDTQTNTYPSDTTVYEGACRVQVRGGAVASADDFGGRAVTSSAVEVQVPVGATEFAEQDVVVITSSEDDPALAGNSYLVESVEEKSHATVRRLLCQRVTRPGGS